jgi:hypothetical protein
LRGEDRLAKGRGRWGVNVLEDERNRIASYNDLSTDYTECIGGGRGWGGGGGVHQQSRLINILSQHIEMSGGMLSLFLFIFTFTEHTYNILYIILVECHSLYTGQHMEMRGIYITLNRIYMC